MHQTLKIQKEKYGNTTKPRTTLQTILGTSPLHEEATPWYRGSLGEQQAAETFQTIKQARTYHSVPIGDKGSDIDHIILTPSGIYTINTKYHPNSKVWASSKAILVNGKKQPYYRNSTYEAERVKKILEAHTSIPLVVKPALAIISETLTIKNHPQDITITNPAKLTKHINKQTRIWNEQQLNELHTIINNPTTWVKEYTPYDSETPKQFHTLHKQTKQANLARTIWRTIGAIAFAGVVITGILIFLNTR